jgi:excisionase family DNA binding protein
MERRIMTVEEVATYLQISKRSVYKLIKEGKLPATRILNKYRLNRESIDSLVRGEGEPT